MINIFQMPIKSCLNYMLKIIIKITEALELSKYLMDKRQLLILASCYKSHNSFYIALSILPITECYHVK